MKKYLITAIGSLMLLATGCMKEAVKGTGRTVDENRNLAKFTGVDLKMDATIKFVKDTNYFCIVSAQENVLDVLETEVRAGTLKVGVETGVWLRRHSPITIEVHAPSIENIEISGSGNFNSDAELSANTLDLRISGSGKMQVKSVKASKLNVEISGSGSVNVNEGNADDVYISVSGSGKIEAREVLMNYCDVNISGSGSAYVNVLKKLYASISGSGSVYYKGSPVVETHVSGSGKIRQL